MSGVAGAILAVLLYAVLPTVTNEVNQGWATNIKQRAEELARKIYTKLVANSQTKDKLMEAYQNNDTQLMSALINQAGYSTQRVALEKAAKEEREKYLSERDKLTKEGTELQNDYNRLLNAANNSGTSVSANNAAEQVLKETESLVNGGYHEETKIQ